MKANPGEWWRNPNATIFSYEYTDLQVQLSIQPLFSSVHSAAALETEGFEFDLLWQTDIDGLTIRST